jgi:hypothetical protein
MRMWMIDPKLLCTTHLIGEHGEIHKHRHNFVKKHKISGRIFPIVQIEPESMQTRHDILAEEMNRRKTGSHKSPYIQPSLSHLSFSERYAEADLDYNLKDLCKRCAGCRKNILGE